MLKIKPKQNITYQRTSDKEKISNKQLLSGARLIKKKSQAFVRDNDFQGIVKPHWEEFAQHNCPTHIRVDGVEPKFKTSLAY